MTDQTPEDAQSLDPREDHGPWTATGMGIVLDSDGTPLVSCPDGNMGQQVADLVAASPDMRATIAAQTWEWGRRGGGGVEWHRTEEAARHHVRVAQGDLVRRPVGPVEVVE